MMTIVAVLIAMRTIKLIESLDFVKQTEAMSDAICSFPIQDDKMINTVFSDPDGMGFELEEGTDIPNYTLKEKIFTDEWYEEPPYTNAGSENQNEHWYSDNRPLWHPNIDGFKPDDAFKQQSEEPVLKKENSAFIINKFGSPFSDTNWASLITDNYGQRTHPITKKSDFHFGLDIAYPEGTPVLNVIRGKVMEVSYHWSYGLNVVVESEDGTCKVRYAHLSAVSVGVGETIATGETVGLVGSTGVSSGPHLHIEIMVDGQLQNPQDYLPVD